MTIIKLPAAYDVAGSYQRIADWGKVSPRPLFVAHKATEGNFYQDPYFKIDFAGMLANGIRRGAYHFFRKSINSLTQAQYFCNYVRGTLTTGDFIILDMEEGGETIAQILAWLDGVEAQYINEIIIYSNKSKIDALAAQCTPAELTRLRNYKIWIAGYPFNPDLYSEIPASYIPAGFTVCMWQYSSQGRVAGILTPGGIQGDVDLDWLSPAFIAELGGQTPPIGEPNMWIVTTTVLNVRNGIGTTAAIIGTVVKDDIIEGVLDVVSNWIHISKRNGVALDGWCSGNALYVTKYTPPARVVTDINIALAAGSVVTRVYSDGSTESETA